MNKMVDVAIIDSGIDMRNTDLCNMVSKGFSLDFTNSNIVYQNEYNDLNGHGTYCASIIRRFCPEVRFTILFITFYKINAGKRNLFYWFTQP